MNFEGDHVNEAEFPGVAGHVAAIQYSSEGNLCNASLYMRVYFGI